MPATQHRRTTVRPRSTWCSSASSSTRRGSASMPDPDQPRSRLGLRTKLASQGITGITYLELDFVDPKLYKAMVVPWQPRDLYIPSMPSTISQVQSAAQALYAKVQNVDLDPHVQDHPAGAGRFARRTQHRRRACRAVGGGGAARHAQRRRGESRPARGRRRPARRRRRGQRRRLRPGHQGPAGHQQPRRRPAGRCGGGCRR